MTTLKLKHYIVIMIVFFSWFNFVHANVLINEIMYNLDGPDIDYIEIYNPDTDPVDLASFKILISNSTSNHSISNYSGSSVLNQGEYGIITPTSKVDSFISKWGSMNNIFTSSFTLPNVSSGDSASVEINSGDKNIPIDSVSYDISLGANNNGKSLQYINSNWIEMNPTPGKENIGSTIKPTTSNTNGGSSSGSYFTNSNQTKIIPRKINTKLNIPRINYAGLPVKINSSITTNKGETLKRGNYKWNFGDGTQSEVNNSTEVQHTYYYPGDYVVTFQYSEYKRIKPDVTSRFTIKILPPQIGISSIGNKDDAFVEIKNKSNYEINLSNWTIRAGVKYFVIPANTILLAKKKLKLSPRVTGFTINNLKFILFMNPNNKIVSEYPIKKIKKIRKVYKNSNIVVNKYISKKNTLKKDSEEIINLNELSASLGNIKNNYSTKTLSILGLFGIIMIASISVLLLKKKDNIHNEINGEIRPEDMTIIE